MLGCEVPPCADARAKELHMVAITLTVDGERREDDVEVRRVPRQVVQQDSLPQRRAAHVDALDLQPLEQLAHEQHAGDDLVLALVVEPAHLLGRGVSVTNMGIMIAIASVQLGFGLRSRSLMRW